MQNRILTHMFGDLSRGFAQPEVIWQAVALLAALALAWVLAGLGRKRLEAYRRSRYAAVRFGADAMNKAL